MFSSIVKGADVVQRRPAVVVHLDALVDDDEEVDEGGVEDTETTLARGLVRRERFVGEMGQERLMP